MKIPYLNPPKKARRSKGKRAGRKVRKHVSRKINRPRRAAVKKSKIYRKPRSIAVVPEFKNPFLGEIAIMGNPKHKKHRKHGPRRHRRAMSLFRNPPMVKAIMAGPREMVSFSFVQDAASAAVGFVLPNVIVSRLPVVMRDATWKVYGSKVLVVAGLSGVASIVSKRVAKLVLLGGGVSLLLDVYADFVAPMFGMRAAQAPAPAAGTSAYYGTADDRGVGAYYGTAEDRGVGAALAEAYSEWE